MIITPRDHAELVDLGKKLLDAAGDEPERVRTTFMGAQMAYDVDDDLAESIGRTPDRTEYEPNAQPIVRDVVGEPEDAKVLPNVMPGAVATPDVPESPNERMPAGNDELIAQPEDDTPKTTTFGEGTGQEPNTTSGSTGTDGDRAGVVNAEERESTSEDADSTTKSSRRKK